MRTQSMTRTVLSSLIFVIPKLWVGFFFVFCFVDFFVCLFFERLQVGRNEGKGSNTSLITKCCLIIITF